MKIKHLLIGALAFAAAVACKQDEPVATPELKVDKEAVTLTATAGEATFNVTSNQDWTATADADWVSVEPASGSASEKAVEVKVTAEDNEATEARTATVTVKAGELTKTVALTQAGTEEVPGPELPTPNADWTSAKVVSYDLPESASSKRQLLKNIKYTFDENYFYVKLQASVAEFEAAPAEYLGVFVYDVVDGSGDGYYGWWNDAKGNTELEGEHIGVFSGKDITLTIGETPVEVTTEENGDELVWTLNILRSAHPNLALENPYFAFLTYIGWEPNGALPDKYENMLQFTPAVPEPEYTLDGKQWMAEVDGMQVLFDFGLAEEGMLSVGMPSMDGTGFGLFMAGLYEIVPADATSGVINFTQYDWEWDEFADPVEIPYSELTATTVKAVSEGVFGTTEPISFTLVENPYEIAPPQTGGDGPSGAIENGEYWFFNGDKVMAPLAEGETTGVLPAGNVIDGASTVKNIFTLTYDPDWTYYTIQDSYGRYLGQTDETGNITVTDVLPADDTYAFYLWAVETGYGEACSIYNAAYYYDITYSAADNNWVLVDGGYEYPETLPVLVKAENPVEEPVVPQTATIASVLALGNGATIPADTFVEGFVISNMDLNNLTSKKGMYIQDETAGLQFYLAANHTFKFGDKVKVDLSGAKVGEYSGAVQISGLDLEKIEVLSSGNTVEPKTVTIADFLANKYEGQYVAVENVQVAKSDLSKTWVSGGAHTSINIEDADGNKFVVFSSKYATYGTSTVSQGAGTLKGIASINNGKIQLIFAQNSDYAGLTGTRFGEEVVEPEEPETPDTPDTPATGNRADFETLTRTSSYTAHTTTAGWVLTNCAVQEGYTTDINPQYILIGKVGDTDTWAKAACMNGKTSAVGTIESPEIAGGCGKLEFDFAHIFSDKNGMDFDIEVIQNGAVVKTINVKKTSSEAAKMTKLHFSEEVNVSGTFKLKFTNNCPSATDGNKDRVSIWNLTWTSVQ